MKCPYCKAPDSRVINSRTTDDGNSIRRRRECSVCNRRFTTYEYLEKVPLTVIKSNGKRVIFDKEKILSGIIHSCYKRDICASDIANLVDNIIREIRKSPKTEIHSKEIGEIVMRHLKYFDEIAYIRFASVYRQFTSVDSFKKELENLQEK